MARSNEGGPDNFFWLTQLWHYNARAQKEQHGEKSCHAPHHESQTQTAFWPMEVGKGRVIPGDGENPTLWSEQEDLTRL